MIKRAYGIVLFGLIEVAIGAGTLAAVLASLMRGTSTKPLAVLLFVLLTSATSLILGVGLMRRNDTCYRVLLSLSAMIVFSKVLIFAGIITLSGALETSIPSPLKHSVSLVYHLLLLGYFLQPAVRKEFRHCAG